MKQRLFFGLQSDQAKTANLFERAWRVFGAMNFSSQPVLHDLNFGSPQLGKNGFKSAPARPLALYSTPLRLSARMASATPVQKADAAPGWDWRGSAAGIVSGITKLVRCRASSLDVCSRPAALTLCVCWLTLCWCSLWAIRLIR